MRTKLEHFVFNIDMKHASFYRDLFSFLGWRMLYDGEDVLAVGDRNDVHVWFNNASTRGANDYDGVGLNHFAIGTATQSEVDQAAAFVAEHGIVHLFETPRHRPEFAQDEDHAYYQIMFETPDRLLVEIVYTGPKL